MQKLQLNHHLDGSNPRMPSEQPEQISKADSPKLSAWQIAGAQAADRLFDLLPPQDVGDPAKFLAAVSATFAAYPQAVLDKAPLVIAQRSDRPTLKLVTQVCDELYEPIGREHERNRGVDMISPPTSKNRTPEQQARVDEQVAAARKALGISEGFQKRVAYAPSADQDYYAPVPTARNDGQHAKRVMAELEMRRARAQSTDPSPP